VLIAVILFLVAEQIIFFRDSATVTSPITNGSKATTDVTLVARVDTAVNEALGPSDRHARRFAVQSLTPDEHKQGQSILHLRWAINGNLALGSVSAWAQFEAYSLMEGLFTSGLPLSSVDLTGTFGDHDANGHAVEVKVLQVSLDSATAALLDWGNLDANSVWPLLHRVYVRPGFECQCQE
jgi:hypothetical protein